MIFMSMRELRSESSKLLDQSDEIIITRHGKPAGILTPVKGDFEETLRAIRQARFGQATRALQADAKAKGLDKLSEEEVNALVDQARRERRH